MKRSSILSSKTIILLVIPILLVAYFYLFTGPRDISRYPSASQSPYHLPWPAGISYFCIQSNRGVVSHNESGEFAYDFVMPMGSDISAARAGTVVFVVDLYDGNGVDRSGNSIFIQHEDGTLANYAHIRQYGSYVEVGQQIKQGQVISASGNVGTSLMPHLHFHVTSPDGNGTVPVTFADVVMDAGIPRMFKWYTSGNE